MYQQMIFVNLATDDVAAARKFFTELGYAINPQFSTDDCACVVISDTIVAMLLSKQHYATFTKKEIADSRKTSETLICLSAESREKVDELVGKRSRRAAPRAARPRTTASCTAAPSTTSTATPGRSCGWTGGGPGLSPGRRGVTSTETSVRLINRQSQRPRGAYALTLLTERL